VPDLDAPGDLLEPGLGRARPLDEGDGIRRQVVVEQGGILVAQVREAVQVEMGDGQATSIGVPDREGRRGDLVGDAERPAGATDQRGLAGAEVAADQDDISWPEAGGEPLTDRLGLRRAVGVLGQPPNRPIWSGSGSRS